MTALAEDAGDIETARPPRRARLRPSRFGPVFAIAVGSGIASSSMNFWIPFVPLYMKDLGATSDANALFWTGFAISTMGVARLVTGPVWGILSDRYGRKLMFVRALAFASITTSIAAFATEPWHIAVAFGCQGVFSGFIPAAVALTSVSVPDSKLNSSLGYITGAQYLGNTIGPAVGSVLAILLGMRGAIITGAVAPALAALLVLVVVPRDDVQRAATPTTTEADGTPAAVQPNFWRSLTFQFFLMLFFYFFLIGTTQLVRIAAPIAIENIEGTGDVAGVTGIAFTIAGIASIFGILVIGRRYITPGNFRPMLALGCAVAAGAHVLLAISPGVVAWVAFFSVLSLAQAAMVPATNTLIAANVPRERRGTAFGLAGSAQALAFMIGPMMAAWFAATSMNAGFIAVGGLFVLMGAFLAWRLREPAPTSTPAAPIEA